MRFSIVIPVYNVEKYIGKCLDTVMHQTFDDYEVIIVNDETPDNSMQIVQKYVDEFPDKIRVYHQKNTRQGGARNNGVSRATGEYIIFVDSDDYVALNMLETVDQRLRENTCDILCFQNFCVQEDGIVVHQYRDDLLKQGVYYPERDKQILMLACTPWGKAYRREFYLDSGMAFPEKLLYEDAVTRLLYAKAESICLCEDKLYYYVQRSNSSIRQGISEKMLDILTVTDIVIEEFRRNGLYDIYKEPLEASLIYGLLYILDIINSASPDHPLQVPMADYLRSHFPKYKENPYINKVLAKAMDYLLEYDFRKYHYRILIIGSIKERILMNPVLAKLNSLNKRS